MTFLSRAALIPALALFDLPDFTLPPMTIKKAVVGIFAIHAGIAFPRTRARVSAPECAPVCKAKTLA